MNFGVDLTYLALNFSVDLTYLALKNSDHFGNSNFGSFPFVPPPPSLVGAYYLQPPDARAIILHNDLLSNDACSVTGGSKTYWGGTNGKDPKFSSKLKKKLNFSQYFSHDKCVEYVEIM